jgi:hypothetical protein
LTKTGKTFNIVLSKLLSGRQNMMTETDNDTYSERRIDKRLKSELSAEYKLFGEDLDILSFQYKKTTTIDISKRGVCLEVASIVHEGDVMRLDVNLGERKKINTFGEVEWCKCEGEKHIAGISFISLSNNDAETLSGYLATLN